MDQKAQIQRKRYSCYTCHSHFELDISKDPICPFCGEHHIQERCLADPYGGCHCALTTKAGIKHCDVCGQPVCPDCGDHNVTQISRVTGYLQDVSGWNAAKQQELKDRQRHDPISGKQVEKQIRTIRI